MRTFSVLIIGSGQIAALMDTPESEMVLTHAHAFTKHNGYQFIGFLDSRLAQAETAASIWGGEVFASLHDAFSKYSIDVVIVAVPDQLHCSVLKELLEYPVKLVFCEKPLSMNLKDAEETVSLYKNSGISLAINYTRRFLPEIINLKEQISAGEFGRLIAGTGYYGKGLLHNGSHLIDLIRYLLGDIIKFDIHNIIDDHTTTDPSVSCQIKLSDNVFINVIAIDSNFYSIFELDLLFHNGRITLKDSAFSIEKSRVIESTVFPGYRILEICNVVKANPGNALLHAADNLYSFLCGQELLLCNANDGLEAVRICTQNSGTNSR